MGGPGRVCPPVFLPMSQQGESMKVCEVIVTSIELDADEKNYLLKQKTYSMKQKDYVFCNNTLMAVGNARLPEWTQVVAAMQYLHCENKGFELETYRKYFKLLQYDLVCNADVGRQIQFYMDQGIASNTFTHFFANLGAICDAFTNRKMKYYHEVSTLEHDRVRDLLCAPSTSVDGTRTFFTCRDNSWMEIRFPSLDEFNTTIESMLEYVKKYYDCGISWNSNFDVVEAIADRLTTCDARMLSDYRIDPDLGHELYEVYNAAWRVRQCIISICKERVVARRKERVVARIRDQMIHAPKKRKNLQKGTVIPTITKTMKGCYH